MDARGKSAAIAVASLGTVALVCASVALAASGGQNPSSAPGLATGSHPFSSCQGLGFEFWSLPNIVNSDQIVLAVNGVTGNFSFLPPFADDYNWRSINSISGSEQDGNNAMRISLTASQGDGRYLIYVDCDGTNNAYDFVVESITHALRVNYLPRPTSIPYRGVFTATIVNGNGNPVSESSLHFALDAKWGGTTHVLGTASPVGGKTAIRYALPKSLRGKRITVWVTLPQTGSWQATAGDKISVAVR